MGVRWLHNFRSHLQAQYSLEENGTVSSGICSLRARKLPRNLPVHLLSHLTDQKYLPLKKYFVLIKSPVSLSPSISLSPLLLLSTTYCCFGAFKKNSTIWSSFCIKKYGDTLFVQSFCCCCYYFYKEVSNLCQDFWNQSPPTDGHLEVLFATTLLL